MKKQYINPSINMYSLTPSSHICAGSAGTKVGGDVVTGGTTGIDDPDNIL